MVENEATFTYQQGKLPGKDLYLTQVAKLSTATLGV
uniref:Uncharacterized protein n=1 Tax=Polynucleobacter necessarius subsp. necessarius (strain STIR1) TaxID=452638 RepID=B1XVY3_POLNS